MKVKGVYKHQGKYVVKKYGCYIGIYSTIEEANFHAKEAEKERLLTASKPSL